MSPAAAIRFFSLLALVAGGGALAVVVMRLVPSFRPVLGAVRDVAVWMAFAVAATATLGSLYFSEIRNLLPCRLCWFQRIFMYPLAIVLLVGAIRRDRGVRWYAVPLAGLGVLVSAYHYFIEWNPQFESDSCALSVPCSVPYFREFGFVSLAFMALCGFAAILALLSIPSQESTHGIEAHPTPADDPAERG